MKKLLSLTLALLMVLGLAACSGGSDDTYTVGICQLVQHDALDAATEGVANFHLWFLAHLCRFLGFSPGNEYIPDGWFNIAEGLYTTQEPPREYRISQENALILRDMLECDVRYIAEIGLNRHQRVDFLAALVSYYGYHLDTINSVQSIRILQEVF